MDNERIVSCYNIMTMDNRNIRKIVKIAENEISAYFTVMFNDGQKLTCGPAVKKDSIYKNMLKLMNNVNYRNNDKNIKYDGIYTKRGNIKNYGTKKNGKLHKIPLKGIAAVGLAATLGFGIGALSKKDINVEDVVQHVEQILDKFEYASEAGTMTDQRLYGIYSEVLKKDPYNAEALNFFNYLNDKEENRRNVK